MQEIRIHGYGGQGTVTLAELVAYAELRLGRQVQTLPFFGMERRGAPVRTALRLSEEDLWIRSQVYCPGFIVALNDKLIGVAIREGIADDGFILANRRGHAKEDVYHLEEGKQYPLVTIDAVAIAVQTNLILTGQPLVNVPMFGAMASLLHIPEELVREAIEHKWPKSAAASVDAALQGYRALAPKSGTGRRGGLS